MLAARGCRKSTNFVSFLLAVLFGIRPCWEGGVASRALKSRLTLCMKQFLAAAALGSK